MQNLKSSLFGKNVFTEAFKEFDEEAFFENLHNRVKNKSYFQKYKGFKNTLLALSYLFNVASALTASYAIFWLTKWITGFAIVGYVVAAIFLFFLEKIKRKSSSEFWQVWFFQKSFASGWFGLSMFCLAISLVSSGFGVKEGTEELAPSPELIAADSMATYYRNEIAKLENTNTELKANKDTKTGITFYNLNPAISANTQTIKDYSTRLLELDKQLEGKNEQLTGEYLAEVNLTAWSLVWLTVLMELLFEACLAYLWYYFFRSYVERRKTVGITEEAETKSQAPLPYPTSEEIEAALNILKRAKEASESTKDDFTTSSLENEKTSLNGVNNVNNDNSNLSTDTPTLQKPIGFFTEAQRKDMGLDLPQAVKTSGQVWTDVDRAIKKNYDDRYTVEHTYQKGGKTKTVRYTMRMVKSRIGQYEREIEDAEKRGLGEDILQNRRNWLEYWQGKKAQLLGKMVLKSN